VSCNVAWWISQQVTLTEAAVVAKYRWHIDRCKDTGAAVFVQSAATTPEINFSVDSLVK
jgi:hypothetical protein